MLLIPWLGQFIYLQGAEYSDLTVTHYPNLLFLRRWLAAGVIPFWSPAILSGFPFAANPLSGLWYPPGWLALLLPGPLAFNLLMCLHLVWGSIGMYLFLRERSLGQMAALLGGLAFGSMPKQFAHLGAGHVGLIYAIAWTPWLLRSAAGPRRFFQPGLLLAVIFLADVRWAAYAGLVYAGWLLWNGIGIRPGGQVLEGAHHGRLDRLRTALQTGAEQLALLAIAVLPLALPLLEYTGLSTRASMQAGDVLALSLPPAGLFGLIAPSFNNHEWVLYPGGPVLILTLIGLLLPAVRRRASFWVLLLILSLAFSLGSHLPGMELLAGLPGMRLLRVPPRALFLTGMAMAILSAHALQAIADRDMGRHTRAMKRLLVAIGGVAVASWLGFRLLSGQAPAALTWGAAFLLLGVLSIAALLGESRSGSGRFAWLLIALCLIDWGGASLRGLSARSPGEVFGQGARLAEYLAAQPGLFRIYSPSYSLPQHTAARYDLELADGVEPLQLDHYADFMERASGVPFSRYSITLPPIEGDIDSANAEYVPDPELLGLLNVQYVVADFEIEVDGLALRQAFGRTRVYENLLSVRRAWVEGSSAATAAVQILERGPNRIRLAADGPGRLVLSEINYPGWQVRVDGRSAEMQTVEGVLRSVVIGPGSHQIEFVYAPRAFLLGMILSALLLVLLAAIHRGRGIRPAVAGKSRRSC